MADMTREEAAKVLARYNYVPGRSKTVGMPDEKRAEIKRACRVLARPLPPAAPPAAEEE